jgi:hypothetical protein
MPKNRRRLVPLALVLVGALLATVVVAQAMMSNQPPEYLDWTRLNPQKNFISSAHPAAKDVYVNDAGAEAATTRTFPFPEGSELIKETLDPESRTVTVITAMAKVAGFDPENGDWQYGMFERMEDGSIGGMWAQVGDDMHQMCVSCHVGAAETDYAFLTYTGD